jgi:lipoate-protein ligase A
VLTEEDLPAQFPPRGLRSIAKRPTGGGIVFHTLDEVVYCLVAPRRSGLLPESLGEAYLYITHLVERGLQGLGFSVHLPQAELTPGLRAAQRRLCFAQAESYELITPSGEKVVGSAQRRTKDVILQQGTIKISALTPQQGFC